MARTKPDTIEHLAMYDNEEDIMMDLKKPQKDKIPVIIENTTEIVEAEATPDDENFQDVPEIKKIRESVQNVVDMAEEQTEKINELGDATEHARWFEVASTMMKTIIDANKMLYDMEKDKAVVKSKNKTVINNDNRKQQISISPKDLQQLLKEKE